MSEEIISLEKFEEIYNLGAAAAFDSMIDLYKGKDHYEELYAGSIVRNLKKLKDAFLMEDITENGE